MRFFQKSLNLSIRAGFCNLRCLGGLAALATPLALQAGPAEDKLEQIFGREILAVANTPASQDDLDLAKILLEAARRSSDEDKDIVPVLCWNVQQLAQKDPAGAPVALEAMNLLLEVDPDSRLEVLTNIVEIRQNQFKNAKTTDERNATSESMVTSIVDLGQEYSARMNLDEAILQYRRAHSTATSNRSPQRDRIKSLMDQAIALKLTIKQVETLKATLEQNPSDQETAKRLIKLYLIELDLISEARKYTFLLDDPEMKNRILLASSDPLELTEEQLMQTGDWYRTLAEETSVDRTKGRLLHKAVTYFQNFLDIHIQDDLLKIKVTASRDQTASTLKSLNLPEDVFTAIAESTPASGPRTPVPGNGVLTPKDGWIELIEQTDPVKHATSGTWSKRNKVLISEAPQSRILFPATMDGSYEMQAKFARLSGQGLFLSFPVADHRVHMSLDYRVGYAGIGPINGISAYTTGNPTQTQFPGLRDNTPSTLDIKVTVKDEQATIAINLNNRSLIRWQGPLSTFGESREMKPRPGFYPYTCTVAIQSVRVHVKDGTLTLMTDAARSADTAP